MPKQVIYLYPSTKKTHKYMAVIGNKTVHFGAKGYSDYTKHKDKERMKRYVKRHKARENWGKSGIKTAGFWSRWVLWNKPSLTASIKDLEKRFNVKVVQKRGKPKKKRSRSKSRSRKRKRSRSKSRSRKRKRSRSRKH